MDLKGDHRSRFRNARGWRMSRILLQPPLVGFTGGVAESRLMSLAESWETYEQN